MLEAGQTRTLEFAVSERLRAAFAAAPSDVSVFVSVNGDVVSFIESNKFILI